METAAKEAIAEVSSKSSGLQWSQISSLRALRVTKLYHCGKSAFVSKCCESTVAAMIASIKEELRRRLSKMLR